MSGFLELTGKSAGIVLAVPLLRRTGEAVRLLRERAGKTQGELAKASGLALSVVSRVELGRQAPSIRTLGAMMDALGVSVRDLADALDAVDGRAPQPRPGNVSADLLRHVESGTLPVDRMAFSFFVLHAIRIGEGRLRLSREDIEATLIEHVRRVALSHFEAFREIDEFMANQEKTK